MSATTAHSTCALASLPVRHSWLSWVLSADCPDPMAPNPPKPPEPLLPPPRTLSRTTTTRPTSPRPPPPTAMPRPPKPPNPPPPPRMSSTLDVSRSPPSLYLMPQTVPSASGAPRVGIAAPGRPCRPGVVALDSLHAFGRRVRAEHAAVGPRPGRALRGD